MGSQRSSTHPANWGGQMNRMSRLAILMLGLGLSAGVASGMNPPHSPDDHFLCYRTSPGKFGPVTVNLTDQFETGSFSVSSMGQLCAPANKNSEGVVDSVTHLATYTISAGTVTPVGGAPSKTGIRVVNQLMDFNVDITKADRIMVPANKSLSGIPPAPDNNAINVDHYKCYKAKASPGQPRMTPTVHVQTQFDNKDYVLRRPTRLCTPVDKNGEGIKNPVGHMMCYKAVPKGPRHSPTHIFVNSQLGPTERNTVKEIEFCVPSLKNPAPPVCGDNFQQFGEGCDGTDSPACPGQCIGIFNGQDVCDCPGPHPFVLVPGDPNSGAGSLSIPRGTLGHDSDAVKLPLNGTMQVVVLPAPPSNPAGGVFALSVAPAAFPPVTFLGQTVCAYLVDLDGDGSAGSGLINCFGVPVPSPPSSDFTLYDDHCTACDANGGSSCDSGQQVGVCGCATNAGCSGGQICASGQCFTPCAGAGQGSCANPTQTCSNPGGGVCLCSVNADCPAGETCSSGACIKTCATVADCTAPAPTQACAIQPNSCTPVPGWTG